MLVKQFGKPKSAGNVFDNDKDKPNLDESGTNADKSLSNDKSYFTNDSDKPTDKSQDKDSELK
ncbi:hypothetical protein DYY66_0504 [Candidatus Nitrosotalea sp. FS]|nr:hypothetical protein [Candidatus Nitrosotalea sp. FS]